MPVFSTPPAWYSENGYLNNILFNTTYVGNGPENTSIGHNCISGGGEAASAVAVGNQVSAIDTCSLAIGSYDHDGTERNTVAQGVGGIAIGSGAQTFADETIAIGRGASAAEQNTIQLGNNNIKYNLRIGNGNFSLFTGSTAENSGNWISATSSGISQGLYFIRYGAGSYVNTIYLMAPIEITDLAEGTTHKNDWYIPFYFNPNRLTINSSHPVVTNNYYLKISKDSTSTDLKITPGYYVNNGDAIMPEFKAMSDGSSVMLFRIL